MNSLKDFKSELENRILSSRKVIIVPHKRIDLDAIGSAIGLATLSEKLDKPNYIIMGDQLSDIDRGAQSVIIEAKKTKSIISPSTYHEIKSDEDFYILTDVSRPQKVWIPEYLDDFKRIAIVDHHSRQSDIVPADLEYIDTNISSASDIVGRLLMLFKIKIYPELANYLLSGIYLDSDGMNKNVLDETLDLMSKLVKAGGRIAKAKEYVTSDFYDDRTVQELVNTTRFVKMTLAIMKASNEGTYSQEQIAKAADYVLKFNDVDASFAIATALDGKVHISARSKGNIDVGEIMYNLGGGGSPTSGATEINDQDTNKCSEQLTRILIPKYMKRD